MPAVLFQSGIEKGAVFSECRTWRYSLWRIWSDASPLAVIGLNPSTADETEDDPTIRRCIRFAKDWGYGGLYMLNLFAFRATDPRDMKAAVDPVGPDNDVSLRHYSSKCGLVLAAWGVHGGHQNRGREVTNNVLRCTLHCLGKTKDGDPRHPLYIRADQQPEVYCDLTSPPPLQTPAASSPDPRAS